MPPVTVLPDGREVTQLPDASRLLTGLNEYSHTRLTCEDASKQLKNTSDNLRQETSHLFIRRKYIEIRFVINLHILFSMQQKILNCY
jgi:hypothetical protein